MSLINEALKKAQRARSGDAPGHFLPAAGGVGPRVAKRDQPRTAQQLVLIAAGVIVLVVLSVVITVYLVNQPPDPKPTAATPKPAALAPVTSTAKPAAEVAPVLNPPLLTTRPAAEVPPPVAQTPVAEKPAPASSTVATASPAVNPTLPTRQPAVTAPVAATAPTTAPVSVAPAVTPPAASPTVFPPPLASAPTNSAPAPTPATPPRHDERISAFIDAIRVAGIRSSGTESRVLMNDRVYRVNEIVDRNFGLRLTKVEPNTLTFTDANGVVYVKTF